MRAIEAVKQAAEATGMPTTHIGQALGKSRAYVSSIATRGSTPQADTLAAMLGTMGYALAALPVDELPPGALVIDPPGE